MPRINDLFPSIFSNASPPNLSAKEVVLRLGRFYNGTSIGEAKLRREFDIWSGLAEGRVMLPHDRDNLGWWDEPPFQEDSCQCSISHQMIQGLFADIGNSDVRDSNGNDGMPQSAPLPLKAARGFEVLSTELTLHFWVQAWSNDWLMVTKSAVIHLPTMWICDCEVMDRAWNSLEEVCFKGISYGEGGEP